MFLDINFPCLVYVKVAKNQNDVYNLLFLQKKLNAKLSVSFVLKAMLIVQIQVFPKQNT